MKGVDAYPLYDLGDIVADGIENIFVPLMEEQEGRKEAKGLDGRQFLDAVLGSAVDACDGSKAGFHIAIAGGLAAPWIFCGISA